MKPETMEHLRPVTLEDLKSATYGQHFVYTGKHDSTGRFLRVRVNGKPKTWKTRPNEVRVPWKYGLYEYGAITHAHIALGLWFVEMSAEDTLHRSIIRGMEEQEMA